MPIGRRIREPSHRRRLHRQQDRALDPAEKQERGDVLSVDADAEMQAQFDTVPRLDGTDVFSARNGVAGAECGVHRLVARDDVSRMGDRKHPPVDDESGKVNDSRSGRIDVAGRSDIDASVPGRILRRGRDERAHDDVRAVNRPRPVRLLHRRDGGKKQGHQKRKRHASILRLT